MSPTRPAELRSSNANPLRVGALGCADILKESILDVLPHDPGIAFVAIASRDPARARAYAREHSVPKFHDSYADLLADPEVDLVYNPLPNGLHCEWSIRAMQAGKPVLCQKPIAANAREAERMAAVARETGQILIEAWHYRHHPVARRIASILSSGVLGKLRHVESRFQVPGKWVIAGDDNIRFSYALAGGVTMDPGCYCVNLMRWVVGEEPRVVRATARLHSPKVDVAMEADLVFPGGCTAHMLASLDYVGDALDESLHVVGEDGELEVIQPCMPHWGEHFIRLKRGGEVETEQLDRTSGFVYLWRDVVGSLRRGEPILTPVEDAILGMRVIDSLYVAAGLTPRGV